MKTKSSVALFAVVLIAVISGCTQSSTDNADNYGDISTQVSDDTENINTDLGMGELSSIDDYDNSMESDLSVLRDNSEPSSDMGLGEF